MVKTCCVYMFGCASCSAGKEKGLSFHRLPTDWCWYVLQGLPSSTRRMWRRSLEDRTEKERRQRWKKKRSWRTKRKLIRRKMMIGWEEVENLAGQNAEQPRRIFHGSEKKLMGNELVSENTEMAKIFPPCATKMFPPKPFPPSAFRFVRARWRIRKGPIYSQRLASFRIFDVHNFRSDNWSVRYPDWSLIEADEGTCTLRTTDNKQWRELGNHLEVGTPWITHLTLRTMCPLAKWTRNTVEKVTGIVRAQTKLRANHGKLLTRWRVIKQEVWQSKVFINQSSVAFSMRLFVHAELIRIGNQRKSPKSENACP